MYLAQKNSLVITSIAAALSILSVFRAIIRSDDAAHRERGIGTRPQRVKRVDVEIEHIVAKLSRNWKSVYNSRTTVGVTCELSIVRCGHVRKIICADRCHFMGSRDNRTDYQRVS